MPTPIYFYEIANKNDYQNFVSLPAGEFPPANMAPAIFYDTSQPFNGFNKDASRYSGEQGFEAYVRIIAEVSTGPTDTHVTEYIGTSAACSILANDEQTNVSPTWSKAVTITDSLGNVLPAGYLKQDDIMTMVTVFTLSTGDTANYPDIWAINRVYASGGSDIQEFSSIRENRTDGIYQPIAAMPTNHLKVEYTDATHITTRCLIDGTKLKPNQQYNFSQRIDYTPS